MTKSVFRLHVFWNQDGVANGSWVSSSCDGQNLIHRREQELPWDMNEIRFKISTNVEMFLRRNQM